MNYDLWMSYIYRLRHIMDDKARNEAIRREAEHYCMCNDRELQNHLDEVETFLKQHEK